MNKIIGNIVLIWGVLFALLAYTSDILMFTSTTGSHPALENSCLVFILLQPLWYLFHYEVYIVSHTETNGMKCKYACIGPLYSLFMLIPLLPNVKGVYHWFTFKFNMSDQSKLYMFTLENTFRISIGVQTLLGTLPMMIISFVYGNLNEWAAGSFITFILNLLLFIRDMTLLTKCFSFTFFDAIEGTLLRPRLHEDGMKIEREVYFNLKSYLQDPDDQDVDDDGNTSLHQATKFDDLTTVETRLLKAPHLLFMLNNDGYTPLDMCIMEGNTEKAEFLIQRIKKFHANSNLRFVKKANRLDLKFEKALTLAIMKNNTKVISAFPSKSIKTILVSMSQVKNYNLYKQEKSIRNEVITSPIHLACKLSLDDAVRCLIEKQNFDVNMLLDERSCIYELLCSSSYIGFNILSYLLKVSRPDINCGNKIPLNQALLRGNLFMIKTLVEFGKPNFYVKDSLGLAPIHIAAQKIDMELFDSLVMKGADPSLPDDQGNTVLHMLCEGAVRDVEYDFIKECIEKYKLRLTRNKDHKTPFNLIRAYPKKTITARQGPNFRRKVWDYFEEKVKEFADIEDADKNSEVHLAIIRGQYEDVVNIIGQDKDNLEMRNLDGKTPLMLSIEHERHTITEYLLKEGADISKRESRSGNNVLHIACKKSDLEAARIIYKKDSKLCLQKNFDGNTSIHLATQARADSILQLFDQYKFESLSLKNKEGENPLFIASRIGDSKIFQWFAGQIDFFKARGERNYKGQTIEHIVCLLCKHEIVEDINPRPDTKDYYGNLPIFYTIMNNDTFMINKYFTKTKGYNHLRNYKNQTLFHIAAQFNSLEALEALNKRNVILEDLLKKDYKGDTPLHTASKQGNIEILEYYLRSSNKSFIEVQNDFGLSVYEASKAKLALMEEQKGTGVDVGLAAYAETDDIKIIEGKIHKLKKITSLLDRFDDYVTPDTWNQRYDISYDEYMKKKADPDMCVFMEYI